MKIRIRMGMRLRITMTMSGMPMIMKLRMVTRMIIQIRGVLSREAQDTKRVTYCIVGNLPVSSTDSHSHACLIDQTRVTRYVDAHTSPMPSEALYYAHNSNPNPNCY